MFRRHLGYTPAEVDAMPLWQRRLFTEGLNEEFSEATREDDDLQEDGSGSEMITHGYARTNNPNVQVTDDLSALGLVATEF